MQVVDERGSGLDVHKKTVVACVLLTGPDGVVQRTVRTFSTMTADRLLALGLAAQPKRDRRGDGINRGVHASPNVANWGRRRLKKTKELSD